MLNIRHLFNGLQIVPRSDGSTAPTEQGDLAVSSVDGKIYYHDGTIISPLLTAGAPGPITNKTLDDSTVYFIDTADNTKGLHFDVAGTTATKTTVATSQTVDRVLTLPDATDTLVARATTDTLTNKTIDGASNTITNVSLTTGVTGILPIANGGTGSATQNFVDLTTNQTIGGNKTFTGTVTAANFSGSSSGTNTGDVTLAAFGSTPNANAASITGQVLNLQPADATNPGGVSITTQSFTGAKTFITKILTPIINDAGAGLLIDTAAQDLRLRTAGGGRLLITTDNGMDITEQGSTPSNPASGRSALYFKTDHLLYSLDSTGSEKLIGSGGGSGGFNFIGLNTVFAPANANDINAESSIGNWKVYQDTPGIAPVNMNGTVVDGTPVTITRTTTGGQVLNGSASFLVTKPAANKQGEGVSVLTNVPPGYRGATALITVPFKVLSGALLNGDLKVFIYDVTNSQLITPISNSVIGAQGIVNAAFSVPSTCAQLRFGIHFASTSTAALTFSFDDVFVGVSSVSISVPTGNTFFASSIINTLGSGVTSATFTTPDNSPAFTFTPSISGKYRVYSTCALVPSAASISIQSRIFNTSANATLLFESQGINFANGGQSRSDGFCESIYTLTAGTQYVFDIQLAVNTGTGYLDGGNSSFYMFANLVGGSPVSGTLPNAALAVALTSNYTTAGGDAIKYDTILVDTAGGYRTSTGVYTVPTNGDYKVSVIFYTLSGAQNYQLYKNGVGYAYIVRATQTGSGSVTLACNAGDTLYVGSDAGATFDGNVPYLNYLSIEQIPLITGGSAVNQLPRSEVYVYGGNGNGSVDTFIRRFTTVVSNTGTDITYAVSANNGSTFTVNVDGIYSISYTDSSSTGTGAGISKNSIFLNTALSDPSNDPYRLGEVIISAAGANQPGFVGCTLFLAAGSVIRAQGESASAPNNTSNLTAFRITKVSN